MYNLSNRPLTTCLECRRRKLRCDRGQPSCIRCRTRDVPCIYGQQDLGTNHTARPFHFVQEQPAVGEEPDPDEDPDFVTISTEQLDSIESRIEKLSRMVKNLKSKNPDTDGKEASPRLGDSENAGHLFIRQPQHRQHISRWFWASMCKEVTELDALLTLQHSNKFADEDDFHQTFDFSTASHPESELSFGGDKEDPSIPDTSSRTLGKQISAPNIEDHLTEEQALFLSQVYIQGYHPLVPLVHVPSFLEQSEYLLRNGTSPNADETVECISLVLAVCFAGVLACTDEQLASEFPDRSRNSIGGALNRVSLNAVRVAGFPSKPTLRTLTAYIICQSSWLREDEPLTACAFVGLAQRAAHMLGLHKDPSHFPEIGPIEAEVRRRVWWQIVHIDVTITVATGLPPTVDTSWDVQPLSELKDEFIGTPQGLEYEQVVAAGTRTQDLADDPSSRNITSMVSTGGILVRGKLHSTFIMRKALIWIAGRRTPTANEIRGLRYLFRRNHKELLSRIQRIPDSRVNANNLGEDKHQTNLNKWARCLLALFIDRNWTLVCHPLFQSTLMKAWSDIYDQTISHCQGFLLKTAYLACNTEFTLFQWSWPGNHQPLHAMMLILQFLIDSPHSTLASDCRNAVDFVLALYEDGFGLVAGGGEPKQSRRIAQGGTEAWKFFFRQRKQAWEAAGLNPSQLWSRREAVRKCLTAMENVVTNEKIKERFLADDPDRDVIRQEIKSTDAERRLLERQIDALLDGQEHWIEGGLLW
ncbi:hypothetical protein EJ08DRAFT_232821 [Tothia fuscella]|uniref:Zn(2)-C6 fungal-type domain-containing protein n=1 Tax=Tothia fuscella TaxID=1048955 RepID=A0A9P4P498_9PEZI|nr:hypothetical protein EJ08DRAFT_232821 [Tothia fuscella]